MKKEEIEKIDENKLEWVHGGDGVEYELWEHKDTKQMYRVPIEIVRDFSNMEETKSCFDAKFGR